MYEGVGHYKLQGNQSNVERGNELEEAYQKILKGKRVGGFKDGGIDMVFSDLETEYPIIQIKSSWQYAMKSLALSAKNNRFIPVCVGDPTPYDDPNDIFDSIKEYGGWLASNIDRPMDKLEFMKKVRWMIESDDPEAKKYKAELFKKLGWD